MPAAAGGVQVTEWKWWEPYIGRDGEQFVVVKRSEAETEIKKAHDSGFEFEKYYRDKMGEDPDA